MFINNFLYKKVILFVFFWTITFTGFSQFKTYRISTGIVTQTLEKYSEKRTLTGLEGTTQRKVTLSLPFFDDFAQKSVLPKSQNWQNNGVILSNSMPINPPSVNAAVFDSYNLQGQAYNITSTLATGFSDTLSTQNIDLSAVTNNNDLVLSFWWQAQGNGERPDATDSLFLEAKLADNTWKRIWSVAGGQDVQPFKQELLLLNDNNFFHNAFQFRFTRYGRLSGNFDVFLIDYIYLNSGRNILQTTTNDIACTGQPQSYLKRYQSMPLGQYLQNPVQWTNSKININLNNLDNEFRFINFKCTLKDTITNTNLGILPVTALAPSQILINQNENYVLEAVPQNVQTMLQTLPEAVLEYQFTVNALDDLSPNLRLNDTLSGYTALKDFYAYDDGTAEYVAGTDERFGKLAVQYVLSKPAQLTDVDICFVPFLKDLSNQTFILSVWKKFSGRNEEKIFQKSVRVKYPNTTNGFVRFPVDSFQVVNVSDTIYVGVQLTSDDFLAIGFDKSYNSQPYTFATKNGIWQQYADVLGSLMIRPVFDNNAITATEQEFATEKISLYPNPAQNIIWISGNQVKNIRIYDILGSEIQNFILNIEQKEIEISNLAKGMYFLHIFDDTSKSKNIKTILKFIKE
jgi:hypothetical protein